MLVTEIGDPRLQALFGGIEAKEPTARPMVRLRKGVSPALFGMIAVALTVLLFSVLNERRAELKQPRIRAVGTDANAKSWPAPPPLFIPPTTVPTSNIPSALTGIAPRMAPAPRPASNSGPARLRPIEAPLARPSPPAPAFSPIATPDRDAPVLIDRRIGAPRPVRPVIDGGDESSAERIRSSVLANPSLTIPQGSLVSAVLETGFDSTRPGFARAIVSRDVRSFDGKNVLIPRGSRLIGESQTPLAEGQKTAPIIWTRLIRPDGVTMELDSPATDAVGRGGVPASVNTHFLSRVGSAVGKAVDVFGQILAARAGPLLILPSIGDSAKPKIPSHSKRAPTLKVAPGTSITVFVAHDLDFSSTSGLQ